MHQSSVVFLLLQFELITFRFAYGKDENLEFHDFWICGTPGFLDLSLQHYLKHLRTNQEILSKHIISEKWKLGIRKFCKFRNITILSRSNVTNCNSYFIIWKLWDFETWEIWNLVILKLWNLGIWNFETWLF